ncbi:tetratricopeptide repeat protein [Hansschlegelia zhihuaiae]|uniref:Tetratricopeptide repeat protein n=1 Tax=Hansschlegelia zhihuaiae TaxID=405005 RepID=A0A4Q0MGE2_9HYPH|nr:tetratricopeptide repeat protein [Hansschlegelia zhihuaiae]RXF72631.1 hypothetical protein EK403_13760 [Hansschlegelia zhihuaiae]
MAFGLRAVIASLLFASALAASPARAAPIPGSIAAGVEPQGYARVVFAFERMPGGASARLANGVLVVSFDEQVALDTSPLTRGLGALIGVVRRDPDGAAIRMSLTKPVKLIATEAGEKLFVDLLPPDWAGLPPPLPRELIADLTREAREGREIRAQEARRRVKPQPRLTLEGATHPTFRRLIFGLGGEAPVDVRRVGEKLLVTIGAPYAFDVAAVRARLPPELAGLDAESKGGGLVVSVPAPGGGAFRGFREDGDFLLDVDRTDVAPSSPATGGTTDPHGDRAAVTPVHDADAPASVTTPARPEAAGASHAPAEAVAPSQPTDSHAAAGDEKAPAPATSDAAPPAKETPSAAAVVAPSAGAEARAASVRRIGGAVRLVFPFARATPAAMFLRGRTLWAVFDDRGSWSLDGFVKNSGGILLSAEETPVERGRAVRLKLAEARLVSAAVEGADWVVSIGDEVMQRSAPLAFVATFGDDGRARASADLPGLGAVRVLRDPDIGDMLAVATLGQPARNVQRPQSFVEFSMLVTAQGVALALAADDLRVRASVEQLLVEHEGGLNLSATGGGAADGAPGTPVPVVVTQAREWAEEIARPFRARENELMRAAALASAEDRPAARLALARFYHARGRASEAKAVLDAIVEDGGISERDGRLAILRSAVAVELGRPTAALAILASPSMRMTGEAQLWRAAAEAAIGHPGPARTALKLGERALPSLPAELRARFVALAVDLALDAGDGAAASAEFERLEVLPATRGFAARELARARVAEALGQTKRAAAVYASLAKTQTDTASAEAELRGVELSLKTGESSLADAIARLERLTTGWRGDDVEAEALARLIGLYGDAGRWREAFSTLRTAVAAFPEAEETRALQDRMQSRFTDLFLGAGVDSLPKLDALALFYDFKELSPGGRRGDELVRRLADKLVDVDLLDQAAELLDYQIDNRLAGAARAQVAARAALVDLMNSKPAKALETLRKTRQADLPASLIAARLRLEARALAETGRVDLALEMAAGLEGPESDKLEADILWTARRWPEAGEALEATLGSSWRRPDPLTAEQRADVLRAAIALSLADDGLGVDRLRQKFAPKMADSAEAAGFEVVTAPIEARGDAFREIARSVAARSSFETFLREYRKRGAEEAKPGRAPAPTDRPAPDATAAGAAPSRA